MSTIQANLIEPSSGTTVTFGASGDTVAVGSGATTSGFAGGLSSVQTFTSSGTWTRPAGITKVIMEVQGAGGSGSGSPNGEQCNGGAAGGYAKKLLDVSSISTSTITVGAGGAGVDGGSGVINGGNDGGFSKWADGTNTITANGGGGGDLSNYAGTEGATATGGDINIQGGDGSPIEYGAWAASRGGSSFFGTGGHGKAYGKATSGWPPRGYGAGSGSVANWSSTYTSDTGGAGIVIVWEYK